MRGHVGDSRQGAHHDLRQPAASDGTEPTCRTQRSLGCVRQSKLSSRYRLLRRLPAVLDESGLPAASPCRPADRLETARLGRSSCHLETGAIRESKFCFGHIDVRRSSIPIGPTNLQRRVIRLPLPPPATERSPKIKKGGRCGSRPRTNLDRRCYRLRSVRSLCFSS